MMKKMRRERRGSDPCPQPGVRHGHVSVVSRAPSSLPSSGTGATLHLASTSTPTLTLTYTLTPILTSVPIMTPISILTPQFPLTPTPASTLKVTTFTPPQTNHPLSPNPGPAYSTPTPQHKHQCSAQILEETPEGTQGGRHSCNGDGGESLRETWTQT